MTPNDDGRAPDATASMTDVNARERAAGAADGWTRAVPRAAAWQDPLLGLALAVASVMTDPDVLDGVHPPVDDRRLVCPARCAPGRPTPLPGVITGTLVVAVFLGMQITEVGDRLVSQVAVVVALYTIGAWGRDRDVARGRHHGGDGARSRLDGRRARRACRRPGASVDGVPLPTLVVLTAVSNTVALAVTIAFGETSWRSAHRLAQLEARTRSSPRSRCAASVLPSRSRRCASPASCTTWSPTTSASSESTPGPRGSRPGRTHRPARRWPGSKTAPATPVDELHGLLTTLREDDGAAEDLAPASLGVDLLPALVADARSADGGEVLRVDGTPRPLRPTVEATVVRIAQEALTNVRKHAGPGARVAVTLRYEPDRVALLVESTLEASGDRVSGPGRAPLPVSRRRQAQPPASATSACASGQQPSVAPCRRDRRLPETGSPPGTPSGWRCPRDRPRARGRRPGTHAGRDPRHPRDGRGPRGRREAADGQQAVDSSTSSCPTSCAWTCRCPGMDGLRATEIVVAQHPEVAVLVLTTFDGDEYLFGALRAGASGFIVKNAPPGVDHRRGAGPRVGRRPAGSGRHPTRHREVPGPETTEVAAPTSAWGLTPRELEVVGLVAAGLSNDEIAEALVLGATTVKTHVSHVLAKLRLRDRVQLVVFAFRNGLV